MTKITEKQLIESLRQLKAIKPRKEWAVLLKSQILSGERVKAIIPAQKISFSDILLSVFAPKKLAYVFAVILFLIIGIFGFTRYTSVDNQTVLKQNVAALSNGINDLAKQGKTESVINEIQTRASELARNTKSADAAVKKEIAASLKTLADVTGVDLSANPDVNNLYQNVVQQQISDFEKATLTDSQKTALSKAEDLYNQGNYESALDIILTQINK